MSGAVPRTTASMSDHDSSASSRAREAAWRTRPPIVRSPRDRACLVCPMPMTATGSAISVALQDGDQVVLEAWPRGGMGDAAVGGTGADPAGDLDDADQPGGHHRVAAQ